MSPKQDGHHLHKNIFKWIFLNDNVYIPIQISLKFVTNGPINNIPDNGSDNGLAPARW